MELESVFIMYSDILALVLVTNSQHQSSIIISAWGMD